jgi:hypothetical protein
MGRHVAAERVRRKAVARAETRTAMAAESTARGAWRACALSRRPELSATGLQHRLALYEASGQRGRQTT